MLKSHAGLDLALASKGKSTPLANFRVKSKATSCKTQQSTIHYPQSTIIKDSVSVTYRQGVVISPADYADSAAMATSHASLLNASSVGEATSNEAHKMSLPRKDRVVSPRSPLITQIPVRVDTVYIERWHTREVQGAQCTMQSGERKETQSTIHHPPSTISRFYKDCTWGFFLLLLLILGRFAFKLIKLIYLRR